MLQITNYLPPGLTVDRDTETISFKSLQGIVN